MRWVLVLCVVAMIPATALAFIPYPENCTTPDCIRICPGGDIELFVEVKDEANNSIPLQEVRIVFNQGADENIFWCPGQDHPVIAVVTDVNGQYKWFDENTWEAPSDPPNPPSGQSAIYAGGCHPWEGPTEPPGSDPLCVVIEADPGSVPIGVYDSIGSPDCHTDFGSPPNGDGDVDLLDFVVFAQMFDSINHCGDYHDDTPEGDGQCDRDVDLLDFVVFAQHFDHVCPE